MSRSYRQSEYRPCFNVRPKYNRKYKRQENKRCRQMWRLELKNNPDDPFVHPREFFNDGGSPTEGTFHFGWMKHEIPDFYRKLMRK